jgi:hypothetical protein
VQHEAWLPGIAAAQQGGKVAIYLDDLEPSGGLQQPLRERPVPGADLDCGVAGRQADRRHDARDDGRVMQEMLTETLARAAVRANQALSRRAASDRRAAIAAASSIAAIRLPASALPLPARSSAVP